MIMLSISDAGDGCSTSRHDGEEEEEEDSGEDSDGESSVKSHSSHGGGSSVEEPKRPRRTRIAYSNYQLDQLELVFIRTQYPDVYLREEMADRLGIKEDRIQVQDLLMGITIESTCTHDPKYRAMLN